MKVKNILKQSYKWKDSSITISKMKSVLLETAESAFLVEMGIDVVDGVEKEYSVVKVYRKD